MTTLAELKRCPWCKSADISVWTDSDNWTCHACGKQFETPLENTSGGLSGNSGISGIAAQPTSPESAAPQPVPVCADHYDCRECAAHEDYVVAQAIAAVDSLIETAIERCADYVHENLMYEEGSDFDLRKRMLNEITPATVREEIKCAIAPSVTNSAVPPAIGCTADTSTENASTWQTVIVGLPIIRKLMMGKDVTLESLKINLIPDDVLWNNRPVREEHARRKGGSDGRTY